jgi:hypothetical protein
MKKQGIGSFYLALTLLLSIAGCAPADGVGTTDAALAEAAVASRKLDYNENTGLYDGLKSGRMVPKMNGKVFYVFGGKMPVTFPHERHQAAEIACSECHTGKVSKMMATNQDAGHEYCVSCHRQRNIDITCGSCHTGNNP